MNEWEEVKCHQGKEKNHLKNENDQELGGMVRNSIWSHHVDNTNRWGNINTYKFIYLIFESIGNWKKRVALKQENGKMNDFLKAVLGGTGDRRRKSSQENIVMIWRLSDWGQYKDDDYDVT